MYDIKIFLEENWKVGARLNAWKQVIYACEDNQENLMKSLKQGLDVSFEDGKISEPVSRLFQYVESGKAIEICH